MKRHERVKRIPKALKEKLELIEAALQRSIKRAGVKNLQAPLLVAGIDKEFVDIAIEAWSTFKYSYRIADGRWIREGIDLASKGLSTREVFKRIVGNMTAWNDLCRLGASIDKNTQFIVGYTHVVSHDGDNGYGVYRVIFDRAIYKVAGKKTDNHFDVLEFSPKDAVTYALRYVREGIPVRVEWLGTEEQWNERRRKVA